MAASGQRMLRAVAVAALCGAAACGTTYTPATRSAIPSDTPSAGPTEPPPVVGFQVDAWDAEPTVGEHVDVVSVPNPAMPTPGAAEQLVFADAEVLRVQTQSNPPILTVASTPAREPALVTAGTHRLRL